MKTREELIKEARRIVHDWHIDRNYDYHLAERIADFALQVLSTVAENATVEQHESQQESFRVRALRKRGTDKWYYFNPDYISYEVWIKQCPIYFVDVPIFNKLPSDAEMVELECRVVKTIDT